MRFVAFGGARYGERARVGRWPPLSDGDMGDLSTLPAGSGRIAYGCGMVGTSPCIVIRERQSESDRGGYAYTALLDPGERLWVSSGWNGAALIAAILDNPPLRTLVMVSPERLAADLTGFCNSLELALQPVNANEMAVPTLAEALAKALITNSPVAISVPHGQRPEPGMVASVLASLPVCLRGVGWIVGGTPASSTTFGADVVIEEPRAEQVGRTATAVASSDGSWLKLLQRLDVNNLAPAVTTTLNQPAWVWQDDRAHVGRQLGSLAMLRHLPSGVSGQIPAAIEGVDLVRGPLAEPILDAILEVLREEATPFDPKTSRIVADLWLGAARVMPARVVAGLAPEAIRDWLVARSLGPDAGVLDELGLTENQWMFLWRRDITAVTDTGQQVARLAYAYSVELRRGDALPSWMPTLRNELLAQQIAAGTPLRSWLTLDAQIVDTDVKARLEAAVRNRIIGLPESAEHAEDYVLLGSDLGGSWLVASAPRRCQSIGEVALRLAAATGPASEVARAWLTAAATSSIRSILTLEQKTRVADLVAGPWSPLRDLYSYWRSGEVHGDRSRPHDVPVTHPELLAIVGLSDTGAHGALDLYTLRNLSGQDITTVIDHVVQLPRASLAAVLPQNIHWLVEQGLSEAGDVWLRRLSKEGRLPSLSAADLPASTVTAFVPWLLSELDTAGGFASLALATLISAERDHTSHSQLAQLFRQSFTLTNNTLSERALCFRRLASDPTVLEFAAGAIAGDQFSKLLVAAYHQHPAFFHGVVLDEWQRSTAMPGRLTFTLLRAFLLTPEGREARLDLAHSADTRAIELRAEFARDGSARQGRLSQIRNRLSKWRWD